MIHRKKHRGLALLTAAGGLTLLLGRTDRLTTVTYPVNTGKLTHPLRLALVTDLHSCRYGTDQQELLDAIARQAPDALLLGGDILDDHLPRAPGEQFVTQAAQRWPTFYVTGNHEYRTGEIDGIKRFLTQAGVTILSGDCVPFSAKGQTIQLCGADDPEGIGQAAMNAQLAQGAAAADREICTVLLAHRPELISLYRAYPFDLILSGHAHGGQWRIPGLINGLLAPGQGLFPAYAGGRYEFTDCTFIVSRGLARETTRVPRLFNPPELVIIALT